MAALQIGDTEYEVLVGRARQRAARVVGATTSSFDGHLRRTRRAEARVWDFGLILHSLGELDDLRQTALVGFQTVTGALLGAESLECEVEVGDIEMDEDEGSGIYAIAAVVISEVEAHPPEFPS